MQKKLMLLVVLLPLFLIEPVFAAPKVQKPELKKTNFTNRIVISAGSSSSGEQILTEKGVLYVKDAISTGYIESSLDSPISGLVWTKLSGKVDSNTMLGSFEGEWVITTDIGTFEGSVFGHVRITNISGKFAGLGTGDLEGQEIKGSFEGTVNNYIVDLILQGKLTYK